MRLPSQQGRHRIETGDEEQQAQAVGANDDGQFQESEADGQQCRYEQRHLGGDAEPAKQAVPEDEGQGRGKDRGQSQPQRGDTEVCQGGQHQVMQGRMGIHEVLLERLGPGLDGAEIEMPGLVVSEAGFQSDCQCRAQECEDQQPQREQGLAGARARPVGVWMDLASVQRRHGATSAGPGVAGCPPDPDGSPGSAR